MPSREIPASPLTLREQHQTLQTNCRYSIQLLEVLKLLSTHCCNQLQTMAALRSTIVPDSAVLISDRMYRPMRQLSGSLSTIVSTGVVASGLCNCTSTAGAAGTVYGPPAPAGTYNQQSQTWGASKEGFCFDFNEDLAKATLKCYSAESNFVVQDISHRYLLIDC